MLLVGGVGVYPDQVDFCSSAVSGGCSRLTLALSLRLSPCICMAILRARSSSASSSTSMVRLYMATTRFSSGRMSSSSYWPASSSYNALKLLAILSMRPRFILSAALSTLGPCSAVAPPSPKASQSRLTPAALAILAMDSSDGEDFSYSHLSYVVFATP